MTIGAILSALAAIPSIFGYVEKFAGAVTLWWIQRQGNQTLQLIADAAALGARAQTEEERYAVAQAWQTALSRPRITGS